MLPLGLYLPREKSANCVRGSCSPNVGGRPRTAEKVGFLRIRKTYAADVRSTAYSHGTRADLQKRLPDDLRDPAELRPQIEPREKRKNCRKTENRGDPNKNDPIEETDHREAERPRYRHTFTGLCEETNS